MATFEVTIEEIKVFPHPNADRLELARVGLYNIVVAKGEWKTGDKVFYIPEFSVLPENIIQALGLEGKLAGSNHNRVKPVSLRGALSQGVVAPLNLVTPEILESLGEKGNYADALGVTKWEPIIPAGLNGTTKSTPGIVRWVEIENLKKFPTMFNEGEEVVLTEKIHGTCSCYTFLDPTNEESLVVTSKGLGKNNLSIIEDEKNLYWKMAKKYELHRVATAVVEELSGTDIKKVAIFGESFGSVQDLKYGHNGTYGFVMFDIKIEFVNSDGTFTSRWLNPDEVERIALKTNVPTPPVLYKGPFSLDVVIEKASGKEQVSGTEAHIREGVVIRPKVRSDLDMGGTKIAKYVSDAYLTRKNGTEFN